MILEVFSNLGFYDQSLKVCKDKAEGYARAGLHRMRAQRAGGSVLVQTVGKDHPLAAGTKTRIPGLGLARCRAELQDGLS